MRDGRWRAASAATTACWWRRCSRTWTHLDYLDETIETLSGEADRVIAPFSRQRDLLVTISGVARRTAKVIVAETGGDMSRFPSAAHLAS